jgi:hypothetical protein
MVPMKESISTTLRSAFFEALFVVFGVVLALAANEWRGNVKARDVAAGALQDIVSELQTNLDLLRESRTYHKERVGIIQRKLGTGETVIGDDFPRGFIKPAWVTHTAWEVARSTGVIADMDYATALDISLVYDELEHYTRQTDLVGGLIYGAIFDEGINGVAGKPRNLMTIIYTFIFRENQAIAKVEAAMAKYGGAAAS